MRNRNVLCGEDADVKINGRCTVFSMIRSIKSAETSNEIVAVMIGHDLLLSL
jgi:hypothetical protein